MKNHETTTSHHNTTAKIADLYGEAAYQAYLMREKQINKMALNVKNWSPMEIAHLHEQNWKLLKQQTVQPWFIIDIYGEMIPVDKSLPGSELDLRLAV